MKPNVYDDALERVLARVDKVVEKLSTKFKNVKPFAQEPIPKDELLRAYEGLSYDDMNLLVMKHGKEVIEPFVQKMETEKRKSAKLW